MEAEKMGELMTRARDELLERIRDSYTTRNGWNTAQKYILSLMSGAERKNGWQRLSTGAGSKGEKSYDWLSLPLTCARKGFRKCFLVRRSLSHPEKLRGYLCCCKEDTPLSNLVRVAETRWTVEMCFAETKGDVGFDHYEVRSWQGWYRHITLAMCAHALLSVLKAELPDMGATSFFLTGGSGGSLDTFKKGRNLSSASAKQNLENCCGVS